MNKLHTEEEPRAGQTGAQNQKAGGLLKSLFSKK